jgi:hypothetical protein
LKFTTQKIPIIIKTVIITTIKYGLQIFFFWSDRNWRIKFFDCPWYYAGQKILAVIVCQFKKKICNPYFIVIMITVLIMNVIFWVVNFKTQNYFVISTTQNVYLRLSMYDCSNFVYSCRIFGISELQTV